MFFKKNDITLENAIKVLEELVLSTATNWDINSSKEWKNAEQFLNTSYVVLSKDND